jgi:hypothetical protein
MKLELLKRQYPTGRQNPASFNSKTTRQPVTQEPDQTPGPGQYHGAMQKIFDMNSKANSSLQKAPIPFGVCADRKILIEQDSRGGVVNFLEQMIDVEKSNKRTKAGVMRSKNPIKPQNYSQQWLQGFPGQEKKSDAVNNHFLLSTIPPEKLIANLNSAYHVQGQINRSSRLTKLQQNPQEPFTQKVFFLPIK